MPSSIPTKIIVVSRLVNIRRAPSLCACRRSGPILAPKSHARSGPPACKDGGMATQCVQATQRAQPHRIDGARRVGVPTLKTAASTPMTGHPAPAVAGLRPVAGLPVRHVVRPLQIVTTDPHPLVATAFPAPVAGLPHDAL